MELVVRTENVVDLFPFTKSVCAVRNHAELPDAGENLAILLRPLERIHNECGGRDDGRTGAL